MNIVITPNRLTLVLQFFRLLINSMVSFFFFLEKVDYFCVWSEPFDCKQ